VTMRRLNKKDITTLAEQIGWFSLTEVEVEHYVTLTSAVLNLLDEVGDPRDAKVISNSRGADTAVQRNSGRNPRDGEDPLNAIIRWCNVKDTTSSGELNGLRIALKDAISVAGVPMTLGSTVIGEFAPSEDSVVAERILRAGGEIVAITNMDSFAFSGGADTSARGFIGNPFDVSRSAGGSSGGSAACLFYSKVIDASMGCDQGGSIRLPAAWCGVLGLKPTHSLVPYTGIAGIDATFDHAGPMARTASTLARLLAAIAGAHPSDPRQHGVGSFDVTPLLDVAQGKVGGLDGVRIGLMSEGFSADDDLRARTSQAVREFANSLATAGAEVDEVSVPEHLTAGGIAFAGFIEGMAALLRGGGNGYHWSGRYAPDFAIAMARGLQARGAELPPQIKLVYLLGEYLSRDYGGAVYAAAQNQRPRLRAAYDAQLDRFDFLLLPTAPYPPYAHQSSLGIAERVLRGFEPLGNCAPFDMTGHPAITLPATSVDGLPVGVMLVGRRFEDARLVEIASLVEQRFGWNTGCAVEAIVDLGPQKLQL
jgi:amidase